MLFKVVFTMIDCLTQHRVKAKASVSVPSWMESGDTLFTKVWLARLRCTELATQYLGTDDVVVILNEVDGHVCSY